MRKIERNGDPAYRNYAYVCNTCSNLNTYPNWHYNCNTCRDDYCMGCVTARKHARLDSIYPIQPKPISRWILNPDRHKDEKCFNVKNVNIPANPEVSDVLEFNIEGYINSYGPGCIM